MIAIHAKHWVKKGMSQHQSLRILITGVCIAFLIFEKNRTGDQFEISGTHPGPIPRLIWFIRMLMTQMNNETMTLFSNNQERYASFAIECLDSATSFWHSYRFENFNEPIPKHHHSLAEGFPNKMKNGQVR